MKKFVCCLTASLVSTVSMANMIYTTDFTAYPDGLLSANGWNAQSGWHTASGATSSSNNWNGAQQTAPANRLDNMAVGDELTVSAQFELTSPGTLNNETFLNLGVSDGPTTWAGANVTELGLRVHVFGSGWYLRALGDTTMNGAWNGGSFSNQIDGVFTLTGVFQKTAVQDEFDFTLTLGNESNPALSTFSDTIASANAYNSTSLELGLHAGGGAELVEGFNLQNVSFSAVPEPASAALVMLGGVLSFYVRRRNLRR